MKTVHVVSFYAKIAKIRTHSYLITADLLNQNPTKKVMFLYKRIVLIRCCKWISFQSAKYSHY